MSVYGHHHVLHTSYAFGRFSAWYWRCGYKVYIIHTFGINSPIWVSGNLESFLEVTVVALHGFGSRSIEKCVAAVCVWHSLHCNWWFTDNVLVSTALSTILLHLILVVRACAIYCIIRIQVVKSYFYSCILDRQLGGIQDVCSARL